MMRAGTKGRPLLTIGHSNHPIEHFLALLARHAVETVADVRSVPYSRFAPQYRKAPLASTLADAGIGYLFLGEPLGGKPRRAVERRLLACADTPLLAATAESEALQREYDRWWQQSR